MLPPSLRERLPSPTQSIPHFEENQESVAWKKLCVLPLLSSTESGDKHVTMAFDPLVQWCAVFGTGHGCRQHRSTWKPFCKQTTKSQSRAHHLNRSKQRRAIPFSRSASMPLHTRLGPWRDSLNHWEVFLWRGSVFWMLHPMLILPCQNCETWTGKNWPFCHSAWNDDLSTLNAMLVICGCVWMRIKAQSNNLNPLHSLKCQLFRASTVRQPC